MRLIRYILPALLIAALALGCGGETEKTATTTATATTAVTGTTVTETTPAAPPGIVLDPNLQSGTGIPAPEDMPALIQLQSKVPYPVMVPTYLPSSGYRLERELIGASGPGVNDPVGYYSFRYTDPGNNNRVLTFNQSSSNSKPLSGYYLTEVTLNDIPFQVYWHKTLEYLPQGDPVRTDSVGEAETFVVVWGSQYTDAAGQPRELYYSVSTGTWTGHGWGDIRAMLESIKPLAQVGG